MSPDEQHRFTKEKKNCSSEQYIILMENWVVGQMSGICTVKRAVYALRA